MTKRIAAALGLSILLSVAHPLLPFAAPPCFTSQVEMTNWMMAYYSRPNPDKLGCALSYYADSTLYDDGGTRMPLVHFYAALAEKNPKLLNQVYDSVGPGSERAHLMGLHVFWMVNTDESRALLERARKAWTGEEVERAGTRMVDIRPMGILERPLDNPTVIDNLWAVFFATGDERPVRRIASAVHLVRDGSEEDKRVGEAARTSLIGGTTRHQRVRDVLSSMIAAQTGASRTELEEILAGARANRAKSGG
jgi:hypothetical protein